MPEKVEPKDGVESPSNQTRQAGHRSVCQPPVDIHDTPEGLVLRADLPGVSKESLELVIEDNVLKIFAHSATSLPPESKPVHHEFRMGDFYRSFIISDEVDSDSIKAELEDGVLTLRLPKRQTRPRRIELEVS